MSLSENQIWGVKDEELEAQTVEKTMRAALDLYARRQELMTALGVIHADLGAAHKDLFDQTIDLGTLLRAMGRAVVRTLHELEKLQQWPELKEE